MSQIGVASTGSQRQARMNLELGADMVSNYELANGNFPALGFWYFVLPHRVAIFGDHGDHLILFER